MAVTRRPLANAARIVAVAAAVVAAHSAGEGIAAAAATGTGAAAAEGGRSTARNMHAGACLHAWAIAARGGTAAGEIRDVGAGAGAGREGPDDTQALLAAPRSSCVKMRVLLLLWRPLTYSEDEGAELGESVRAVFGCIEGRMHDYGFWCGSRACGRNSAVRIRRSGVEC